MIVLDTHAWLWWLHEPRKLSRQARSAIREATSRNEATVSAISVWEVSLKHSQGKLRLPVALEDWFELAVQEDGISIEAVGPLEALSSNSLPGVFHRDPADRLIVALARRLGAPVVTSDRRVLEYPHVQTIW